MYGACVVLAIYRDEKKKKLLSHGSQNLLFQCCGIQLVQNFNEVTVRGRNFRNKKKAEANLFLRAFLSFFRPVVIIIAAFIGICTLYIYIQAPLVGPIDNNASICEA